MAHMSRLLARIQREPFADVPLADHVNQVLTESGHVWFAAPNRFRWELGHPAKTIAVRQPSLDDVFLKLTGRAIRDEDVDALAGPRMEVRRMRT